MNTSAITRKSRLMGQTILPNIWRGTQQNMENRSGFPMADVFGVTSPKTRSIMVITTMDIQMPFAPKIDMKSTVAILVAAIFTNMLPISIVASVRRGDESRIDMVFDALGFEDWILFFWNFNLM